jgi:cystathionine beta-lyase/cystathionine gamma-synthase
VPLPNVLLQSERMMRRDDRDARRNTAVDAGAQFVAHLLSKYLCGHGDAIDGAMVGKLAELATRKEALSHHGGCLSPFAA